MENQYWRWNNQLEEDSLKIIENSMREETRQEDQRKMRQDEKSSQRNIEEEAMGLEANKKILNRSKENGTA